MRNAIENIHVWVVKVRKGIKLNFVAGLLQRNDRHNLQSKESVHLGA